MKVPGKISVAQKSEPTPPKKLDQNRQFTYFIRFFFSQIKLVIKCNLVLLIGTDNFRDNLFTFLTLCSM